MLLIVFIIFIVGLGVFIQKYPKYSWSDYLGIFIIIIFTICNIAAFIIITYYEELIKNPLLLPIPLFSNPFFGVIGLVLLSSKYAQESFHRLKRQNLDNYKSKPSEQLTSTVENIKKSQEDSSNLQSLIECRQILGFKGGILFDPCYILLGEKNLVIVLELNKKISEINIKYQNIQNIKIETSIKVYDEVEIFNSKSNTLLQDIMNITTVKAYSDSLIDGLIFHSLFNNKRQREQRERPVISGKVRNVTSWKIIIEYNYRKAKRKIIVDTFDNPTHKLNFINNKLK